MAAGRSNLPKFRPATLNALAGSERPKIRPVKPSAPPSPPRRHSSGIRNPDPIEQQPPTQNFGPGYGEPPTMAAARARIHEIARELPAENRFGGERHNFNDETQGRIEPVDFAAAHAAYDRQYEASSYEDERPTGFRPEDALPPLAGHYEAEYPQHDPMTELRPAYDEALQRHEQKYGSDRPAENFGSDRPLPEDDSSGEYARRERRRDSPAPAYNSNSYDAAAYEANYPKARHTPEEHGSYADRRASFRPSHQRHEETSAPESDKIRRDDRRDERREDARSFRRDDFPRESSYRDEPRRDDREREREREREKSYRRDERRSEPRREASSYKPARADETRAEGSSAKHEKRNDSGWSSSEPAIPGPARVPAELRVPDNFVVGVQPIRTPSMGASAAFPQPHAVIAPSYGPPATMAASPNAMGMPLMPQISMPPMMAPMAMPPMTPMGVSNQMHVRAHTSARPGGHIAQPTEVEEAQQGSKVGRFAWFVFGAAFGIFFAFAATGFGFGKKDDAQASFPPPTQLPAPVQTQAAPAPPPPPVVQAPPVPAQPPMMAQQPVAATNPVLMQAPPQPQQQLAPAVAPTPAPPPGVTVAPGQSVGPIVPAQAQPQAAARPAANQGTVRVRPAAPPRRSGGARPAPPPQNKDNDDDAPPPKKSAEPNAADLLGAGLMGG